MDYNLLLNEKLGWRMIDESHVSNYILDESQLFESLYMIVV